MDDRLVFFLDDNLLANRRHARALFDVLRGSGIVWQAAASLDVARDPALPRRGLRGRLPQPVRRLRVALAENMRGNNKPVNAATDYAEACRRFHDAGIMINGSFVFGFDCDGPDVFDRTVEFAIENKILTASFHVLTPLPGTRAFDASGGRGPASAPQLDLLRHGPRRLPTVPDDARATGGRLQPRQARIRHLWIDPAPFVRFARSLEADRLQRGLDEDRPALGGDHPRGSDALCDADF